MILKRIPYRLGFYVKGFDGGSPPSNRSLQRWKPPALSGSLSGLRLMSAGIWLARVDPVMLSAS